MEASERTELGEHERTEAGEVVLGERQRVMIHRWLEAAGHKGPVSFAAANGDAIRVLLLSHRLAVIDEAVFALDGTMAGDEEE